MSMSFESANASPYVNARVTAITSACGSDYTRARTCVCTTAIANTTPAPSLHPPSPPSPSATRPSANASTSACVCSVSVASVASTVVGIVGYFPSRWFKLRTRFVEVVVFLRLPQPSQVSVFLSQSCPRAWGMSLALVIASIA